MPVTGGFMKWLIEALFDGMGGSMTKETLTKAGATGPMATVGATLPSFHTEPQAPIGIPESRDLAHCHPELVRRYTALAADFQLETGRQLFPTCTWRSAAKQAELYQLGRRGIPGEKIVTKLDGVTGRSRHNVYPSQAIDVCVDVDPGPGKHAVWDAAAYAPLGLLALRHGLRWGGDWDGDPSTPERFIDYPHLELPPGVA